MRTSVLAFVAALALGGVAFAQSPAPSPSPGASPAGGAAPAPVVVHIKDFKFVPETLTIAAGQTVRFVEDDETPHTVTASDTSFDSGNMNHNDAWMHAFPKAGTFAYICAYHPFMKGTIVVK